MTSNMVLIRIRYAPSPKGLRHGQRGGPARPGPSGLPTRRQGRALEPSCGHDLPTGESPPARAAENGRNRSARVRDPCRAPYGSRRHGLVDPFRTRFRLCFPIARAVGALHGVSPPPTHGGLRPGNGARSAARTLRIFFRTVRLRRIDHTGVAPPVNVAVSPGGSTPVDWNRFGR